MDQALSDTNILWRVRLFDGPVLESVTGDIVHHFRSRRVGALLAYLVLHLGHPCPREELYEALWPEENTRVVANRLRVALASLRRQLEPSGVPFGTVLDVSDPGRVRLRAEIVWCDTAAFENALKAGRSAEAARLARGRLLPGYYDEWIVTEQARYELLREDLAEAEKSESAAEPEKPSRSIPDPPLHRLPLYLTRFFGREAERRQLLDLLTANRLVTVTGPGGIGKTRLAVETVREMTSPCLFVPLADLPDPERIAEAALQALALFPRTETDPIEHLIAVLRDHASLLLILDNAEHLMEAVAALGLRLLTEIPTLRLLVTSRHRVDVPGEAILALQPLEPPPYAALPERLMEFPSVALFLDRARASRPDFVLTPRHAEALVEICRRLEGMPLALELAAARVTAQSPAQIAAALATSLMDLKSRQRGLAERHRSLRAAMQGSLDLLMPALRAFFAALSVFQGGWTAEAAREVTGCTQAEAFLEELVARSLVVAREDASGGAMRYAFLETLRAFAAEALPPAERDLCAERHARFYCAWAGVVYLDDMRWIDRLKPDNENLLVALEWHWTWDRDALWLLLPDVLIFWANYGYHRVALDWITRSVAETQRQGSVPVALRLGAYRVLTDIGRFEEAEEQARLALQNADSHPGGKVMALRALGHIACQKGAWGEAVALLRESLAAAEELTEDVPLQQMGRILLAQALIGRAESTGAGKRSRDDLSEAATHLHAMEATMDANSRRRTLYHLFMARTLWGRNRMVEGDAQLTEALRHAASHGSLLSLFSVLVFRGLRAANTGQEEEGVCFLAAAEALRARIDYHPDPVVEAARQAASRSLRQRFGGTAFDALWRRGERTSPEEIIQEYFRASPRPARDLTV